MHHNFNAETCDLSKYLMGNSIFIQSIGMEISINIKVQLMMAMEAIEYNDVKVEKSTLISCS